MRNQYIFIQAMVEGIDRPAWVEKNGLTIAKNEKIQSMEPFEIKDNKVLISNNLYTIKIKNLNHNTDLVLKELELDDISKIKNCSEQIQSALLLLKN